MKVQLTNDEVGAAIAEWLATKGYVVRGTAIPYSQDNDTEPVGFEVEVGSPAAAGSPAQATAAPATSRITAQPAKPGAAKLVTHAGETRSLAEWARKAGLEPATLYSRLNQGMAFADAIAKPYVPRLAKARKKS
jgi:hypothetical protein